MDRNAEETKAYAAASEKEIETVTEHIEDLKLAEKDIQDQIDGLEEKIKQLNEENDTFIHQINQQLQPRAQELLRALNSYKRIVEIKKELSAIEVLSFGLGADALEKEAQDDGESPMYDPNPYLINAGWQKWSDLFETMVQACAYPGKPECEIILETHERGGWAQNSKR